MSGVFLNPRFRVSEYVPVSGAPKVIVEMDDFQTALLLSRPMARRLAKSLVREAGRHARQVPA